MKSAAVMFHIWKSLVEKGGLKVSDIPNQWDPFIDFFKPIQAKLREQGMRHTYVYGWEVSTIGVDPINTFNAFMIAYGGKDLVTPDGKLHADNPQVKEAVIKALTKLTTDYKDGYVPPGVVNWNDADDNNAFHSKLCVMDFDGSLSTELALLHNKAEYDDILTHAIPNGNDGKPLPAQVGIFGAVIPKGAKNLDVAREFLKYSIEPQVLNKYLKGGYGRWAIPMPGVAKSDSSFWLDPKAPHRKTYIEETLFGPTIPLYEAYNPASAQIDAEHVFQVAWADIVNHGMTAKAAAEKAFKRAEAIYAKYPIQQA
jgi:multiple sugar transport system substrate-binding protein